MVIGRLSELLCLLYSSVKQDVITDVAKEKERQQLRVSYTESSASLLHKTILAWSQHCQFPFLVNWQ